MPNKAIKIDSATLRDLWQTLGVQKGINHEGYRNSNNRRRFQC